MELQGFHEEEKAGLLRKGSQRPKSQPQSYVLRGLIACLLLLVLFHAFPSFDKTILSQTPIEKKLYDFEDITPSEKLQWFPCFSLEDGFQCARLTVPMDYHRPLNESKDHPKVHLALTLAPGKHDGPRKYSTSPLLLNPGGPGGSGVQFLRLIGVFHLENVIGKEQDVIGFDPRGIGATTPRADCFANPLNSSTTGAAWENAEEDVARGNYHRTMWDISGKEIGLVNSTSGSLQKLDTRARTIGRLCEEKDSLNGKDSILKYVHTPSVARDMISIIDAWDEWTASLDKESKTPCHAKLPTPVPETGKPDHEASIIQDPLDTKGKLVYWGFSYGTLLGATFASMFPDRVGRLVLDGVVDADFYVSPIWSDSLRDTDTISDSFAKYCHQAGSRCQLYRKGDKIEDLRARFYTVLENLRDEPITGIDKTIGAPIIINHSDIKSIVFSTLYFPTAAFPAIAFLFDLLYRGQHEQIGLILGPPIAFHRKPTCGLPGPYWAYPEEAQRAIMCSDKRYPLNETVIDLRARYESLSNTSSWADVWMTIMLGCEGWNITAVDPPMRWDDHPAHKQKPIKTSFPLLFVSNTADPVTPLFAGVKMAKKFVDAGLIEQHSEGHCSLAAVSKCTASKIRQYFLEGKVPPSPIEGKDLIDGQWDKCDADEWPFHPYDSGEYLATGGAHTKEDADLLTAVKKMQVALQQIDLWGQPKKIFEFL